MVDMGTQVPAPFLPQPSIVNSAIVQSDKYTRIRSK